MPLLGEHHEMRVVDRHQRREELRLRVLEVLVEDDADVFGRESHAYCLSQAEQVGQQPVGAVGAGRQLPPEAEADVDPASLADARLDEGAGLRLQR